MQLATACDDGFDEAEGGAVGLVLFGHAAPLSLVHEACEEVHAIVPEQVVEVVLRSLLADPTRLL